MGKQKFYVVWEGGTPGIYTSWTECQLQTKGYEGAKYKSFSTHEEAERAFHSSPYAYIGKNAVKTENKHKTVSQWMPPVAVIPVRWNTVEYMWPADRRFFISAP